MATQTSANGQIAPANQSNITRGRDKPTTIVDFLKDPKIKAQIGTALPRHMTPDRMARVTLTAVRTTPKLAECDVQSFLGCVFSAAQLGLEPNTPLGHCYLIPRGRQCTLLIGYQGMIDLARRSGQVSSIYAHVVRENDVWHYQLGTKRLIKHIPRAENESAPVTHVYAVAELRDGGTEFRVLTRADVEKRRKRSSSGARGPWATDWEAMARKTAVRELFKWLPKSTEMATATVIDEATEQGRIAPVDPDVHAQLAEAGVAPEGDVIEGEAVCGGEGSCGADNGEAA